MTESVDPKEKFLKALEKKNKTRTQREQNSDGKSKIRGERSTGNSPKIFRRKSGSS